MAGDLDEQFEDDLQLYSSSKAKRRYAWSVLRFFRPEIIKSFEGTQKLTSYGMFKNNLKIGWRNILKNKGFFAINTTGLAIGIATCLVILLFVADELSYDRFNEKADSIVRVVLRGKMNGELIKEAVTPAPVAPTLQSEFPEVEVGTRLRNFGTPKITYKNNAFRDSKFAFIDPNFFSVFTLPFIKGDPATALIEPYTVVITQEEAIKYFGNTDPIGKLLELKDRNEQYRVTGVLGKIPTNSHFHFDIFASSKGFDHAQQPRWIESSYHNYLLLSEGQSIREVEQKLPGILKKYMGPQMQQAMDVSWEEFASSGNEIGMFLQPLTDIHLHSDFSANTELEEGGSIKTVYIFSAIALFVLIVACINFINLSTAAASKRAKEVGIRKVLGSQKGSLVFQFLVESFLATFVAMLLGLVLVVVSLPFFNELSGKTLEIQHVFNPQALFYFTGFGVLLSLLAGSYPAIFLSSFKPVAALKNKFSNKGKGIRSGLVVFQFSISVCLIVATLVVDQQMAFIQKRDIGYDKEQLLVLRDARLLGGAENILKEKLLQDARVESVTTSGFLPAGPTSNSISGFYMGESDIPRRTSIYQIDESYLQTMGMQLLIGRNFSPEFGTESSNAIINQTFAKTFGLGENPLGKTIRMTTDNEGGSTQLTVVGMIKDFHFKSLHQPIDPMVMLNERSSGLIVRVSTDDMPALVADIGKIWNGLDVKEPFSYALLDDLYNETYLPEQKVGTLLRTFAVLTIFVSCLGLFGLVTFTTERRFKEIGIRKVLGSSVSQIITMLSFDFLKLVAISLLFAFPIGFFLMSAWLEDFAYRVELHWWIFVASGMIALLITFLTTSYKSVKVAMANPVDSLKDE